MFHQFITFFALAVLSLCESTSHGAELLRSTVTDLEAIWSISPDVESNEILATGEDGRVTIFSMTDLTPKVHFKHPRGFHVYDAAFFPDKTRVISTSFAGTVEVWNRQTGVILKTIVGHEEYVVRVAVTADGSCFATAGADDVVIIWDAKSYEPLKRLHTRSPAAIAFLAIDGSKIATASLDGLKIWDVATEAVESTLDETYNTVSLSIDEKFQWLAGTTMSRDQYASRVWSIDGAIGAELGGPLQFFWNSSMSVDGNRIAAAGYKGTVQVWSRNDGTPLEAIGDDKFQTLGVSFWQDSNQLLIGGTNGELRHYKLDTK